MANRTALGALCAALAALAGVLVVAAPAPPARAEAPVRIMPLGDSITGSPGCWRALLDVDLRAAGHTNVDFVGTLPAQGCGVAHDGEHEGHGGALVTTVADQDQLVPWLRATNPDVVLMHFGTNDVWSNRSTAAVLAAYGKLVDQMRAQKPTVKVLVAKIIPMGTPQCAECGQRVVALNAAIPGWASGKSTAASPITVVDQWTGFATATDTYDGVHPNASGDRKMADRWFPAVVSALNGTAPPTTPPTTPPVAACEATVRVVNRWQGGFQVEVTFRNGGSAATSAWSVRFGLAAGMAPQQVWNGVAARSGQELTVSNAAWNGAVAPAGSATAGLVLSGDPTGWTPTPVCA